MAHHRRVLVSLQVLQVLVELELDFVFRRASERHLGRHLRRFLQFVMQHFQHYVQKFLRILLVRVIELRILVTALVHKQEMSTR